MSDDDAIPMEAGEAAETGIATENVGYKEKVMAEIKTSSSHIDEIRAHTAANRIGDRAAIFQAKHDAQSPVVPKRSSASPAKSSELAAKMAQNLGDKCPRCEKAVFNAEKIEAGGKAYHKTCLRCGFGNGLGCNKVLKTFDYEEYHKVMYCKACARKQHNSALAQRSGYAGKSDFNLTGKGEGGDGTTQARRMSIESKYLIFPSFLYSYYPVVRANLLFPSYSICKITTTTTHLQGDSPWTRTPPCSRESPRPPMRPPLLPPPLVLQPMMLRKRRRH
jgi:hypothetical protein